MDDPRLLTIVDHEIEAEMLCAMLRTEGIVSMHRISNYGSASGMAGLAGGGALAGGLLRGSGGAREVLVRTDQWEAARELLPEA